MTTFYNFTLKIGTSRAKVVKSMLETWNENDNLLMFGLFISG